MSSFKSMEYISSFRAIEISRAGIDRTPHYRGGAMSIITNTNAKFETIIFRF